jgi:hypothetical protein
MRIRNREGGFISILVALVLLALVLMICTGNDADAAPADRVTICHATGSNSNPYVTVTASGNGIYNGHIAHQHGEDIIPRFTIDSGPHAGTYGPQGDQSILANGCQVTTPSPTPTPTTPPPPPPTGPTGPPTGPTGPTEPPVTPEPPRGACDGAGADRPRCQPPTVRPPGGLAFTGISAEGWVLGTLAGILLITGAMLTVHGWRRRW